MSCLRLRGGVHMNSLEALNENGKMCLVRWREGLEEVSVCISGMSRGYFVQADVISLSFYPRSQQHVLRSNKISEFQTKVLFFQRMMCNRLHYNGGK